MTIKKFNWGVSKSHSLRNDNKVESYWLTISYQPIHRWLVFKAYHWYDMRIWKLWGFKTLEKALSKRWHRRNPGEWAYIPLSARQDIRCYHLHEKGRVILAVLKIDAETYEKLRPGSI